MLRITLYFPMDFSKCYDYQYSNLLLYILKVLLLASKEILAIVIDVKNATIVGLLYSLTPGIEIIKLGTLQVSFTIIENTNMIADVKNTTFQTLQPLLCNQTLQHYCHRYY